MSGWSETGGGRRARLRAGADPAVRWQLGWAVAVLAAAGVLLVVIGRPSMLALQALLTIALPGLIGALWRPERAQKSVYLGLWALAAVMAAALEGGLGGPLAVWCVMPAVATIVVEGPWLCGLALSGAALLGVAALNALHLAWRAPTASLAFWLAFIAVVTTAAGAVGGLHVARTRARAGRAEVEAELESFQTLMGDLPELALAMDRQGRAQAVFGRPLAGLDADDLHRGLLETADPADRERLRAALDEAVDHGHARVVFAPALPGAPKVAASLQRTATGGLTAILREAPAIPPRLAPPVTQSAPGEPGADLLQRLKESEAGRRKAEADAEGRARFLANMSHELRTPLNAIMGFSDIMKNRMFGELQPKYLEYAELIHESGGHLLDLINDVLDMSKIEAHRYELSLEVFDAREAVNAALRLMRLQADDAGIKLRGVLPAEPLEVEADRRAIKQVVLNLLSNALKFTPAGGEATLTLGTALGALELVVADSGMGIAPEDLERLGQPYQQAGGANERAQGTGLGLSLVRAFAELHGGRMSLESRLGEGTAVTVRMPVLVGAAPQTPPRPIPRVVPGGAPEA